MFVGLFACWWTLISFPFIVLAHEDIKEDTVPERPAGPADGSKILMAKTEDLNMLKEHLGAGTVAAISTHSEFSALEYSSPAGTSLLAVVQDDCGDSCQKMMKVWQDAALESKAMTLFATVNRVSDDKLLNEAIEALNAQDVPALYAIERGKGVISRLKPDQTKERLLKLVARINHKIVEVLTDSTAITKFFEEALAGAKGDSDVAYFVVCTDGERERASVTETIRFASEQGMDTLRIGICPVELAEQCRVKQNSARLLYHPEQNQLAINEGNQAPMTFTNLKDARRTHVWFRSAVFPLWNKIYSDDSNSENTIAHYSAATVPVIFLVGIGETEAEDMEAFKKLAWNFIGRVSFLEVDANLPVWQSSHWVQRLVKQDPAEYSKQSSSKSAAFQAVLCQYMTSHVCFPMGNTETEMGASRVARLQKFVKQFLYKPSSLKFKARSEAVANLPMARLKVPRFAIDEGAKNLLIGDTYTQWILKYNQYHRLVLLVHLDESCEICFQVLQKFSDTANSILELESAHRITSPLVISALDCKHNDPPRNVEVHSFPRFVLYKKGARKPRIASMNSTQSIIDNLIDSMQNFIAKRGQEKNEEKEEL